MAEQTVSAPVNNRYDRMEIAGAFGDLGTLVPFVVAYIGVLKMDPSECCSHLVSQCLFADSSTVHPSRCSP
jgi:hypothetical protein